MARLSVNGAYTGTSSPASPEYPAHRYSDKPAAYEQEGRRCGREEHSASKRQGQCEEHISVWGAKKLPVRAGRYAANDDDIRHCDSQRSRQWLVSPLKERKAVKQDTCTSGRCRPLKKLWLDAEEIRGNNKALSIENAGGARGLRSDKDLILRKGARQEDLVHRRGSKVDELPNGHVAIHHGAVSIEVADRKCLRAET